MKTYKLLLISALLTNFLIGCKQAPVEVSSVSLNIPSIEMVEGDYYSLVATVLPSNAEYDGISWASSNTSVASVNQGTVTALKEGKTTITASAGGKSATCSVTVSSKYIAVTSITLDKSELSLKVGSSDMLTATVNPANATDKNVQWSSSDASIVKVNNGKVTALKSGTATITAAAGSSSAQCVITVPVEIESLSLDKSELTLTIDETATLHATINPDNATDKTVIWSSSDNTIAQVENGVVVGMSKGAATIKAEAGGKTAECKVTIVPKTATGIEIIGAKTSMLINETQTLSYKLIPDKSEADGLLIWSSSNQDVLTIAPNGTCKAISEGVATVTIHNSDNSLSDSVEITVTDPNLKIGKAYKSKWGYECTVNSIAVNIDNAKMTCTVSYTIKNITTDKKLSECTFKCKKQSGGYASQYGFFGSLYPDESKSRTYTFDTLTSDPFIELIFDNPFRNDVVDSGISDLVWDLTRYY